jgi:hypothetical protein
MENKLGQMIGVVKHSFTCTPSDGSKGYRVDTAYDFTNTSDVDIKTWLCGSRAIAQAKVVNALTMDEIDTLVSGRTFAAHLVGNKIVSLEEQRRNAMATLEALKASNPEMFNELIDKVTE